MKNAPNNLSMRFLILSALCMCVSLGGASVSRAAEITKDSSIDDILDALDARGQGLTGFSADVKLIESDSATGDSSIRTGKVLYESAPNSRIRVTFDKREANKKITEDKVEYLLSGADLIDRTYRTKTQVKRKVLKPGEKLNLLKLGEGPFPLPIGQKKEDVHANFEVRKVEPKKDDPQNTVHLLLNPKPDTRFAKKFKSLDVWVDLKDNMPRRIETLDSNESTIRATELSSVQVNPKLTDADFTLSTIATSDWAIWLAARWSCSTKRRPILAWHGSPNPRPSDWPA